MRIFLFASALCIAMSCDYHNAESIVESNALIGTWQTENVFLNGVNSNVHVDFLNDGINLAIKEDRSFYRNYWHGQWELNQYELVLKNQLDVKSTRWRATVLEVSKDRLVLEFNLTEGEYCCDFTAFDESEVITIREVYRRSN